MFKKFREFISDAYNELFINTYDTLNNDVSNGTTPDMLNEQFDESYYNWSQIAASCKNAGKWFQC